jgi:APA family basic amino acid/polyamine antiporter
MASSLFRKKSLAAVMEEAGDPNVEHGAEHGGPRLERTLRANHLVMLGIGAIIGAGIFALTGQWAATYAGPGIVYSFIISGVLCAFAGLCYSELAAMLPIAGSAYAYTYTTLGELIAWIIGWDLVLEYAFGSITVSISWSGYLVSLVQRTFGVPFPDWAIRLTRGPWEPVTLADGSTVMGLWNLPASVIAVLCAVVLYRGIREASWVNNLIVLLKLTIIAIFVGLGIGVVSGENLFVNPHASGIFALVPEPVTVVESGIEVTRYGWARGGVLTGAAVAFFAYIGFDAVSTTAQEARNPQRDLPIGILGSLVICTVLYVLVSITLTGVVPYTELAVPDPIAVGIDHIVALRGWSAGTQWTLSFLVKLGALAGLTSVILVLCLGQTRIFYAMAHDGLLPWFGALHPRFHTPHVATAVTGATVAFVAGLMPIRVVGELVAIGTLFAFVLVCIGVMVLRKTQPDAQRPFKLRYPRVVGTLGALVSLFVMSNLPLDTWLRLVIWLVLGFAVYFGYGRKHSKVGVGG